MMAMTMMIHDIMIIHDYSMMLILRETCSSQLEREKKPRAKNPATYPFAKMINSIIITLEHVSCLFGILQRCLVQQAAKTSRGLQ